MALRLEQLKKVYRAPDGSVVPVVDVESLSLADGEQVALIGTSGSGKTTLLHLIAGILTPDTGRIVFTDGAVPPNGSGNGASNALPYRNAAGSANGIDLCSLSEASRDVFRGRHIGYIF